MSKVVRLAAVLLVVSCGTSFAQMRPQATAAQPTAAANASWDNALAGKWTYRSYLNRADVIVGDDPEPAVRNLAAIFGQGSTANNAAKALSLIFGEGVMSVDPPTGNAVSGTFDMGGGLVLDLKGTTQTLASGDMTVELAGTGRAGTPTANWEYDYKAFMTPKWPNGVNQIAALVGTVIRAKPHDRNPAGFVASFIAIKQ